MAFWLLITGGDPHHLLTGMILQGWKNLVWHKDGWTPPSHSFFPFNQAMNCLAISKKENCFYQDPGMNWITTFLGVALRLLQYQPCKANITCRSAADLHAPGSRSSSSRPGQSPAGSVRTKSRGYTFSSAFLRFCCHTVSRYLSILRLSLLSWSCVGRPLLPVLSCQRCMSLRKVEASDEIPCSEQRRLFTISGWCRQSSGRFLSHKSSTNKVHAANSVVSIALKIESYVSFHTTCSHAPERSSNPYARMTQANAALPKSSKERRPPRESKASITAVTARRRNMSSLSSVTDEWLHYNHNI